MYRLVTKERVIKVFLSLVVLLCTIQIFFVFLDLAGFNKTADKIAHWVLNHM